MRLFKSRSLGCKKRRKKEKMLKKNLLQFKKPFLLEIMQTLIYIYISKKKSQVQYVFVCECKPCATEKHPDEAEGPGRSHLPVTSPNNQSHFPFCLQPETWLQTQPPFGFPAVWFFGGGG